MLLGVDGAGENLDGGAADSWDEFFARLRDFDFDVAGATHLFTLQNVERVTGGEFAVTHEVGAERTGG